MVCYANYNNKYKNKYNPKNKNNINHIYKEVRERILPGLSKL